mgnify:CR=1 FL=1
MWNSRIVRLSSEASGTAGGRCRPSLPHDGASGPNDTFLSNGILRIAPPTVKDDAKAGAPGGGLAGPGPLAGPGVRGVPSRLRFWQDTIEILFVDGTEFGRRSLTDLGPLGEGAVGAPIHDKGAGDLVVEDVLGPNEVPIDEGHPE